MQFKNIISVLCVVSFACHAADTKSLRKHNNHIELMFFQQAKSGSIKPTTSGCYDLDLSVGHPDIMYFSDSPSKVAGNLPLPEFVETMTHSQDVEKFTPNAILNMRLVDALKSRSVNMIGRLSNARYANKQFHYTFCAFDGKVIKQGEIRSVNLFIDPIHRWPP